MKEKYIILRSPRPSVIEPLAGPLAGPATVTAAPVVEIDEMERSKASELAKKDEVHAVAPAIPMMLIAPFEVENPASPAAAGTAWGVSAVGADTSPFSGNGIVVAVLDTGIDAGHPAFAGMEIVQRDFTGEGAGDQNGHGTHCAGTIFGRTTNGKRIGVAPGIKKALIGKVLGQQSGGASDQIARALEWAVENGANVISMSLGIDFPGFVKRLEDAGIPTKPAVSRALEDYRQNVLLFERLASLLCAQAIFSRSVLLIAAAGNESDRPRFEIAVSPPAVSDGFVSVAALGRASGGLTVANFSNTSAKVAAPGVEIESAQRGGGFKTLSGTSMATPHVAGVAALWAEKLKNGGQLSSELLSIRLLGSANTTGLQRLSLACSGQVGFP